MAIKVWFCPRTRPHQEETRHILWLQSPTAITLQMYKCENIDIRDWVCREEASPMGARPFLGREGLRRAIGAPSAKLHGSQTPLPPKSDVILRSLVLTWRHAAVLVAPVAIDGQRGGREAEARAVQVKRVAGLRVGAAIQRPIQLLCKQRQRPAAPAKAQELR